MISKTTSENIYKKLDGKIINYKYNSTLYRFNDHPLVQMEVITSEIVLYYFDIGSVTTLLFNVPSNDD